MPQKFSFFKQNKPLFILLLFFVLVCVGGYLLLKQQSPLYVRPAFSPQKEEAYSGQAHIGGPFTMQNQEGKPVTEALLQGKNTLMFFGYTHCPDVCPTTLLTVTQVLDLLPPEVQKAYQVIFVTVDPARDTPALLKEYLQNFNESYIGLSGTPEQLKEMAKKYLVYYAVSPQSDPEYYLMDHSAYIYLFDANGQYKKHFSHKATPEEIANVLLHLNP